MRTQCQHFVIYMVAVAALTCPSTANAGGEVVTSSQLRQQLRELQRSYGDKRVDAAAAESQMLALLDTYTRPEDKGLIYASLVRLHVSSGSFVPSTVAGYCEQALRYPQGVITQIDLQTTWANALWRSSTNAGPEKSAELMRQSQRHILTAYAIVLANLTVKERVPTPGVTLGTIDDIEGAEALKKLQQEQVKALLEAGRQNGLIWSRDRLAEDIVRGFPSGPAGAKQLREAASGIITDEAALEELADAITRGVRPSFPSTRPATQPAEPAH